MTFLHKWRDRERLKAEPHQATYDRLTTKAAITGDLDDRDAAALTQAASALGKSIATVESDIAAATKAAAERHAKVRYLQHHLADAPAPERGALLFEAVLQHPDQYGNLREYTFRRLPDQDEEDFDGMVEAVEGAANGYHYAYLVATADIPKLPRLASIALAMRDTVEGLADRDPQTYRRTFIRHPGQSQAELDKLLTQWREAFAKRHPADRQAAAMAGGRW